MSLKVDRRTVGYANTLEEIEREVQRMDPKVKRGTDTFRAAVLLLSAAVAGPNQAATFSTLPPKFTNPLMRRLRRNHIFVGNKINGDWSNPETGGVEFWLAVAVAQGLVERELPPRPEPTP